MIVASGYKVWPREVEDVLYQHPAVREVAVVGIPDAYRGESVKAFVSLAGGPRPSQDELITYCKDKLAAYKVPREIAFLDELPKNFNGKIMHRELKQAAAGGRA
jgi:long-chain acyl-CoA synthetase